MLRGEKVILRAIRRGDLERLNAFNNDVEIEVLGGGDPPLPQSLERFTAEAEAEWAKGGREPTRYAIEADGAVIGECGLGNFDHVARVCELGIGIGDRGYWGKGYGREAVSLLVEYGFLHHNLHRIWLTANADNERARRAYLACGFVEEGTFRDQAWSDGKYVDWILMGILRPEWEATRT